MGALRGMVRGTSKAKAYQEYADLIEAHGDTFLDHRPPKNKKLCKSLMHQDPDTGDWILDYRLHT